MHLARAAERRAVRDAVDRDEVLLLERLLARRHKRGCSVRLHVTAAKTGGDPVNRRRARKGEAAERVHTADRRDAGRCARRLGGGVAARPRLHVLVRVEQEGGLQEALTAVACCVDAVVCRRIVSPGGGAEHVAEGAPLAPVRLVLLPGRGGAAVVDDVRAVANEGAQK